MKKFVIIFLVVLVVFIVEMVLYFKLRSVSQVEITSRVASISPYISNNNKNLFVKYLENINFWTDGVLTNKQGKLEAVRIKKLVIEITSVPQGKMKYKFKVGD